MYTPKMPEEKTTNYMKLLITTLKKDLADARNVLKIPTATLSQREGAHSTIRLVTRYLHILEVKLVPNSVDKKATTIK